VANFIVRAPRSTSITLFAGITRAVECGFIAAGVTVAVVAAIQSITIVTHWIGSL
jgi:Flp pilus assembly pilin Flp